MSETRERSGEVVHPDWIAVHEKVAAARFAVLGEMHQRAGAVLDVYGRHPRPGLPELKHAAAGHDRLDDALAKPRGVAIHQSWQRSDDRQAGDDVSVDAIEGGHELAPARGWPMRFVLRDGTRAGRAVAAGVRDVHEPPCGARPPPHRAAWRPSTRRVRAELGPRLRDPRRSARGVRRNMEDPVGCRFVLPLTRFEQIAHDGNRSGTPQALPRLRGVHETEHTMTTTDEHLDQRRAKESVGSRDERGGACITGHADSVEGRRAGHHPQPSHSTRTAPVRSKR